VIVNPEHQANLMLPVICAQAARCVREIAKAVVSRSYLPLFYKGTEKEDEMKLYLFFVLIDVMILLAYPFIFIASKFRRFFNFKR
jgi:hypothetical protein